LRKLVLCAFVVTAATLTLATPPVSADVTTANIPTRQCAKANYTSRAHDGQRAYGSHYIVENDVWDPISIKQTLYSCKFDSFYIKATVKDRGGAVQSYPSSQYTFAKPVEISKFSSLTSDFRFSHPPTGSGLDYEAAYDVWINNYGGNNHTEMMIWTYNHGQRPAGTKLSKTIRVNGRVYDVWKGGTLKKGGDIVTFVAASNYTSGDTNLLPFLHAAAERGWLYKGANARLWQVDYGAELCATRGLTTFDFTDFNVAFKT
jgi:hypothetical protein